MIGCVKMNRSDESPALLFSYLAIFTKTKLMRKSGSYESEHKILGVKKLIKKSSNEMSLSD